MIYHMKIKMRKKGYSKVVKVVTLGLVLGLGLSGCGKAENSNETEVTNEVETTSEITTEVTTEIATTETSQLILPVVGNDTGKVLIQTVTGSVVNPYLGCMITSSNGESIILNPHTMPTRDVIELNPVAILQMRSQDEYRDPAFIDAYPDVPKILNEEGEITTNDFHIYSVQSSFLGNEINDNSGSVVMVIEVDGLRIAHFGDIGQDELTQDQLDRIGKIDIAFMPFDNVHSGMTLENEKGFNLASQLNSKIVIPTRYTPDTANPLLEEKYGDITTYENIFEVSTEELPEDTLNIIEITNTHKYK